jgi:hypothetical protein
MFHVVQDFQIQDESKRVILSLFSVQESGYLSEEKELRREESPER